MPQKILQHRSVPECWLTVSFSLKQIGPWAETGHEVAWVQHRLSTQQNKIQSISPPVTPEISVRSSKLQVLVQGPDFSICFDRVYGCMTSWQLRGESVLEDTTSTTGAFQLSFWRAPTDNDAARGASIWRHWGLDVLTTQVRHFELHRASDSEVYLKAISYITPPILAWGFDVETTYRILGDGSITTKIHIKDHGPAPLNLPRIGLDINLSNTFDNATWFGI